MWVQLNRWDLYLTTEDKQDIYVSIKRSIESKEISEIHDQMVTVLDTLNIELDTHHVVLDIIRRYQSS